MRREFKETFILRNAVCDAGYEWKKAEDGEPLLVMQNKPGVGLHMQDLHAGVFREFATLKAQDDIKRFADKFGDLFNYWSDPPNRHNRTSVLGRPISTWMDEIADMRVLVNLWDHIKERNFEALKKLIFLTNEGPEYVIPRAKTGDHIEKLAHVTLPSGNRIQFARNDLLLPARCALQIEVNARLSENTTIPELTWTPDTKESGGYHQRITFRPKNLLSAIWIQFAQAITEELKMRRCEYCGKYFQVGPGAAREDARFCKDVCRATAWGKRKSEQKNIVKSPKRAKKLAH
jgi:hypothetical protein